ncbi:MAG: sodium:solute symporter [Bacteroidetes bacterium]|nr:sodium:solute symporter [Bacteroidota bacterium]
MSLIDWVVLVVTFILIISYGLYKSNATKNLEGYFLSNRSMPWYLVLLGIMGTQASAITFLSAPGQAYTDGMRFVQYYFGLPLAMIVIVVWFVPKFSKLKIFTAYEFLEQRFDLKTRTFTSFLFLLSRGLSTGISIYAPSIILSSLLGWDIYWTNIAMGGMLTLYTVSGGSKAVAYTQQLQFIIIFFGMVVSGYYLVHLLPDGLGFSDALQIGKVSGKLNVITTGYTGAGFDFKDRYNIISGTIGGFFLALSYFGTDQSQVGRYITAKNDRESKLGLLLNGVVKIPMQFLILLLGVLLFTFYQFKESPIFFNKTVETKAWSTPYKDSLSSIQGQFKALQTKQLELNTALVQSKKSDTALEQQIQKGASSLAALQKNYKNVIASAVPGADVNDTNYIFLRFVVDYLPVGLVGLLIAVIFLAAWGSIAAALNALASCTVIDFHLRFRSKEIDGSTAAQATTDYKTSKMYTLAWGIFCVVTAQFATGMGSLIEAVNVLGSLFYGVILGIFLVAFYAKKVGGTSVFWAAIIGEIFVIICFCLDRYNIVGIGFLWLNVIGALFVFFLSILFSKLKSHAI